MISWILIKMPIRVLIKSSSQLKSAMQPSSRLSPPTTLRLLTISPSIPSRTVSSRQKTLLINLFSISHSTVMPYWRTQMRLAIKRNIGTIKRRAIRVFSIRWMLPLRKSSAKILLKEMKELNQNHSVTNSISRRELLRPSIYRLERRVSRLILLNARHSLLKPHNGRFSMLTWLHTKRFRELILKSSKRIRKIRNQFNNNKFMLRIHFTQLLWNVLLRLWNVWLSKMEMRKSLMITNTTLTVQRTRILRLMVRFFLYGVSQLNVPERSMWLLFVGTLDTRICSQLDTVPTISWSRAMASFVATQSRIPHTQSINLQLNLVLCALISILNIQLCLLSVAMMVL